MHYLRQVLTNWVIITGIAIQADEYELSEMMAFARKGNYVFIIAHDLSYETTQF
jgi:hypothetical protein